LLRLLLWVDESGQADFGSILVYDVSRWGRFLDADESAITNASNDKKPTFSANFRSDCSFSLESEKATWRLWRAGAREGALSCSRTDDEKKTRELRFVQRSDSYKSLESFGRHVGNARLMPSVVPNPEAAAISSRLLLVVSS
jgi:hypothetical protein